MLAVQHLDILPVSISTAPFLTGGALFPNSRCENVCHLSWKIAAAQQGCIYLHQGRCSVWQGFHQRATENLIITVIFLSGKYSSGLLVLYLSAAPSPGHKAAMEETDLAFGSCAFTSSYCDTAVHKPLNGVLLALMSTSGERYVENWYCVPIKH